MWDARLALQHPGAPRVLGDHAPHAGDARTHARASVVAGVTPRAQTPGAQMSWLLRSGRRELTVPMRSFVVGRGRTADLQIEDESVSRRHARLTAYEDGTAAIEDLGSQNGTFVNGAPIAGSARLRIGDHIGLGQHDLELVAIYTPNPLGHERATAPLARTRLRREPSDVLAALSQREREVFALLAEGIAQREIARTLGVSLKTVETHRTRIGQKLQLKSRADLIRVALAAGVLKPDKRT